MHFKEYFKKLHPSNIYANDKANLIFETVIGSLKVLKINSIKKFWLYGIKSP